MKIVVACDSFKGCLSSEEAAAHIKAGILRENAQHEVSAFQIADGGEGTVEAFCAAGKGELITFETKDAYMKPRLCQYALIEDGKTAVMEVANIIGLSLYPRDRRSPMYATSYGVGLVLKHLIESGIKKIIIALGGSCTNDGGMGML
ncbi:glycerate kinase, partial [Massilicoli timonensis]